MKKYTELSMDEFLHLNKSELKSYLKLMGKTANERVRNAYKTYGKRNEDLPPALREYERSGSVKFGRVRNKDINQLRHEFARVKGFLDSPTSKIREWERIKAETIEELKKSGVEADPGDYDKLWKAYERLKQLDPSVSTNKMKYATLREISSELDRDPEISIDSLVDKMQQRISDIYEESAQIEEDLSLSEFFEDEEE